MNTSIEYIANFKTTLDPYNGLTIKSEDLQDNILEFKKNLELLIQKITNESKN